MDPQQARGRGLPSLAGAAGGAPLLPRIDAFVELVAQRRGLALQGLELAPAERATVALTTGLVEAPASAVELLRSLAQAVGVVRSRGMRVEATPLRRAWTTLDDRVRAGLVYAAWCHRVPWQRFVGRTPEVERLVAGRVRVLRILYALPPAVDVALAELAAMVAEQLDLAGPGHPVTHGECNPTGDEHLVRLVCAGFLDPLVALGAGELGPAQALVPRWFRPGVPARCVVGSALVAAGEDVAIVVDASN